MSLIIWDRVIRSCHWASATLVIANSFWLEGGESPHLWAGYAVLTLLLVRLIWGFVGSHRARFTTFWPTPARLVAYLRQFPHGHDIEQGHNPLGALMVLLLLGLIATTAISGWLQTSDWFWGEEWVEQLHEVSANLLIGSAAVHISAVLLMQRLTGIAFVQAMVTGKRRSPR